MRVLHVAGLRQWGGIYTLLRGLTEYQRREQRLDVAVLSTLTGADRQEAGLQQASVTVHKAQLRGGLDMRADRYARIVQLMRRYDIVHLHNLSPAVHTCAALSRRIIVHTEHGTMQRGNRHGMRSYIKKNIVGVPLLTYTPDAVVYVSDWLRRDIGLNARATHVIHNGLNPSMHGRSAPRDGTFRVLTAGRFEPRKRVDLLIRSIARLNNAEGILLQILGDGTQAAALKRLAAEQLPAQRYEFLGYCADVAPFYERADLFVLPAEREPFGLVLLEAMAVGTPVVCCADSGGAVEIVAGVHERLVVNGEAELAETIEYWRAHPAERAAVGDALREVAQSRFSVARMADDYAALYERLADRTSRHVSNWLPGTSR